MHNTKLESGEYKTVVMAKHGAFALSSLLLPSVSLLLCVTDEDVQTDRLFVISKPKQKSEDSE